MTHKKPPAPAPRKPRNIAAKNLADPRYRPKVEKNPDAYTRKVKHKPAKARVIFDEDETSEE